MNQIDMLVFKTDSFDTDFIIEEVKKYSAKSIILVLDFDRKIKVQYKPSDVKIKRDIIKLFKFRNPGFNAYLSWILFLFDILVYMWLFALLCWKYRPKICWIENTYAAAIIGILKKFNICGKTIYLSGDWLVSDRSNKRLIKSLGVLTFRIFDYISCKTNDVVLDHTKKITEERYKLWDRKITKKEGLYSFNICIKAINNYENNENNAICFLGSIRKDSGVNIIIKSLAEIRKKKQDIILKIIGPKSHYYDYCKKMAIEYNIEPYVQIMNFVERDKLPEILSDCFCGLNLLMNLNSYSSYTIPGKIIQYLQFLLPVITTMGAGIMTSVINENKLGLIIKPSQASFVDAVMKIHGEQKQYRENIVKYINSLPKTDIKEFIIM